MVAELQILTLAHMRICAHTGPHAHHARQPRATPQPAKKMQRYQYDEGCRMVATRLHLQPVPQTLQARQIWLPTFSHRNGPGSNGKRCPGRCRRCQRLHSTRAGVRMSSRAPLRLRLRCGCSRRAIQPPFQNSHTAREERKKEGGCCSLSRACAHESGIRAQAPGRTECALKITC